MVSWLWTFIMRLTWVLSKGLHSIYETWAGGICLTCKHKPKGAQHHRVSVDILGQSRLHMLHMLCNTSSTLKSAELAIHCAASYYNDECCLWLWIFFQNANICMMLIKIHTFDHRIYRHNITCYGFYLQN